MDRRQRDHAGAAVSAPIFYAISPGLGSGLPEWAEMAVAAGATWLQIREKGMSAAALWHTCVAVRKIVRNRARLLLNDRLDVALAADLDGVHLPAHGLPTAMVRARVPPGFLLGRSCHTCAEIVGAAGADFVVFGPVFATPSKAAYGPALGLEALQRACRKSACSVLALGGIDQERVADCLQAGAAGVAAIRLFVNQQQLKSVE